VSIVNALYRLRFTRVVRSQSTLERLLPGEIKKKTPDTNCKMLKLNIQGDLRSPFVRNFLIFQNRINMKIRTNCSKFK
jgi:hypothetical protein